MLFYIIQKIQYYIYFAVILYNTEDSVLYIVCQNIYSTESSVLYRITSFLRVETDIITSIAAMPIGRATIHVTMYGETFKVDHKC
jgi:hypothetical protein